MKRAGLAFVFLWFLIGGIAHFAATDLEMRIVPPAIPWPRATVLLSGAFELLGAAGLLLPTTRRLAGWGLFALTLAVTPANIYMLQHAAAFGVARWLLVLRLPVQALLLALIAWSTAPALAAPVPAEGAVPAAGALRVAAADSIGTVTQVYDGTLTSDIQVNTFRHIERLFPVRVVEHGPRVLPLPPAPRQLTRLEFTSGGKPYDLVDYMALNRVTGLLVLKDGSIAYENYEMGNDRRTRWMSMSMVKTITSTLVGVAIRDGYIHGVDDPVTRYAEELRGSAYEGVSVRQLLQMASGVKWDETYTNPVSDRRRMLDAQIAQRPGGIMRLMAGLPRAAAPGTVWNYSTGETFVAGAVVRAAVGRPLAAYLSDRIWKKAGMESDATWWLESPDGLEIGGSGLSATLRDYGRFGLFLMNDGVVDGEKILPDGWVDDAGSSKTIGGKRVDYGYMTWPFPANAAAANQGAFQAIGIFGQHIYVNRRERVVIVVWSALPKPTGKEVIADADFFAAATAAVR
jgi:CubicO group peptidase (beta-lactamase class C family)